MGYGILHVDLMNVELLRNQVVGALDVVHVAGGVDGDRSGPARRCDQPCEHLLGQRCPVGPLVQDLSLQSRDRRSGRSPSLVAP